MNYQGYMMNTKDLNENRLLTKKDFDSFFDGHNEYEFKKMSINKLRSTYGVTHSINGKYKDMRGKCFKCLTPLRVDYTSYKNYCMDCE
jgi:hypothetical protein